MIALGGSIGTGLFIGSGSALANGGPGSVLIDFLLIGFMLFNVVNALGELAVVFPMCVFLSRHLIIHLLITLFPLSSQGSFSVYRSEYN
jgi:amino acid permease